MRSIRISIAIIVFTLICIGILMIYSASGVHAMQSKGDSLYFLKRHMVFLIIGFIAAMGLMAVDYRDFQRWAKPFLLFSIGLLILVFVPGIGHSGGGAQRWLRIGPFSFQPAELMKVAILVYLADILSRKQARIIHFKEVFLPILIILGCVCLMIAKEDLGSAVLIATAVMSVMFIAGIRYKHLVILSMLVLPAFYFLVYRVPYRWKRIVTFLDPWKDRMGSGFQLTQSQIALGSGGFFGVGLGQSTQKLFYLPAAHTDFILSIIGEEFGFLGTFVVILLFMVLIWQGARIVKRTEESFGYFLGAGIVAMLGFQAAVNAGVAIGFLPTKGLPLPFISYGGSALVVNIMMIGILLNISRISDIEG